MGGASESGAPKRSSRFDLIRVLRAAPTPVRVALGLGLIAGLALAERARDVAARMVGMMDAPTDKPKPSAALGRPKISTSDFAELSRRVRMAGGSAGASAHTPQDIVHTGDGENTTRPGGSRTSGCGLQRVFEIPYETHTGELRHVTVCADCDDLVHWPRFAGNRGQEAVPENASDF